MMFQPLCITPILRLKLGENVTRERLAREFYVDAAGKLQGLKLVNAVNSYQALDPGNLPVLRHAFFPTIPHAAPRPSPRNSRSGTSFESNALIH